MHHFKIHILLALAAFVASLLFLKYAVLPFTWIFLSWSICLLYYAKKSRSDTSKAIWLNVCVALWVLAGFEVYLNSTQPEPMINTVKNAEGERIRRFSDHDILGYGPANDQTVFWKRAYRDEVVFDISYTIDRHGLRISPPYQERDSVACILFFGGSFTFGTGVQDDETLPYLTGLKTEGRFRVYNFGFSGYGPHQMLALLEHQLVAEVIRCKPQYAIYQAITDHVRRSTGVALWDQHGPKYEKYVLHEADGHPTKTAYNLVADYVVEHIIGGATSGER